MLWMPGATQCRDNLCHTKQFIIHFNCHWTLLKVEISPEVSFFFWISTCPTMGLSQALQHPFCGVCTPWRLMSARRDPSICSREADSGCRGLLRYCSCHARFSRWTWIPPPSPPVPLTWKFNNELWNNEFIYCHQFSFFNLESVAEHKVHFDLRSICNLRLRLQNGIGYQSLSGRS